MLSSLPLAKSSRLIDEADKSLTMQLNSIAEFKKDFIKNKKFRVVDSPSFVFDRNFKPDRHHRTLS